MNPEIRSLTQVQHGLVHRQQLLALGLTPDRLRWFADHAGWVDLGAGVYRRTDTPQTMLQRLMAAAMQTGPNAAISGDSAAWMWNLPGHSPYSPVHVRCDRTASASAAPGVQLHRSGRLPRRWIVELDRVPVIRPEVVAITMLCAADPSDLRVTAAVDGMRSQRLVSAASIERCLNDMGRRGRRGVRVVDAYLRHCEVVPEPMWALERQVRSLIAGASVRADVIALRDDELPAARLDIELPQRSVVVEIVGERFGAALRSTVADRARHERWARRGLTVRLINERDVWRRPRHITALLQELGLERAVAA